MRCSTENRERGFTLIELLIAMALGLVVIASLASTFVIQQKTYNAQEQIAEMTQNGRAAMDMMTREIRMTGYGAPPTPNLATWITWVTSPTINNNPKIVDGGGSNPDEIYMVACFDGAVTTLSAGVATGNTSLSVADGSLFNTTKKKVISINGLENAVITGISGNTLTIDTDPTTVGNQGLENDYQSGNSVCSVKVISYSIVDNTLKRNENLGAGRQPLAENIVDLQIIAVNDPTTGDIIGVDINPLTAQTDQPDPDYSQNSGYRTFSQRAYITPPNLLIN